MDQVVNQAGRTLIELLVAISLGLLILLGVGSLFMSASQSSRVGVAVSRTSESGAAVTNMIGVAVRRAAYSEIIGTGVAANAALNRKFNLKFDFVPVRGCTAGRFVNATALQPACGAPPASDAGDVLALAFQSDSTVRPLAARAGCRGTLPAPGLPPVIVNGYWLQGTELQCRSWQLGAPDTGDGVVMAANVLDFKVYFGFDMNAYNGTAAIDAPPVSTAVLTATDIDAMPALGNVSAWEFVVAVHLCLQNFSEEAGVTVASDSGMAPACPSTAAEFSTGQTPLRAIPNAAPPGAIVRVHQQSFTIRTAAAGLP